jgi:pyruvate kinase
MRRAKIVCTLGPASNTPEKIGELIEAGMDVVRLNFSHGSHADHAKVLQTVRAESDKRGRSVGILLDIQGPKIRVGRFADGQIELVPGATFTITTDKDVVGDLHRVSTTYAGLPRDVKAGDQVLLDDGYLTLAVTEVTDKDVKCVVVPGGTLKDKKGINLPGVEVSAPAITEKDKIDLEWGLRMGVDYVAVSFVRRPEDVLEARRLVTLDNVSIPIIAKIEKPHAVDRLEDIIEAADGIMVARSKRDIEVSNYNRQNIEIHRKWDENGRCNLVVSATQMI